MSATPFLPGELDIAMLREMYRNGAVNLAGIDPRLNVTRVAQSLKIGRARVAARMRWWKESGFLQKYAVWLNPSLLGWHGAWVSLRVDHHRSKEDLFRRLGLVDGVISAMDFLGDWVSVAVVAPDPASLQRRVGLLRHLVGVMEVETPTPWHIPEPKRALTPLEIRVVRALREKPTATLHDIARRVGVSTRTMTRRYSELVEEWAIWFVPIFDFTALSVSVVSLNIHVAPGTTRESVSRRLRSRFPLTLDFTTTGVGPDISPQDLVFFVTLPSVASLEELERIASSVEGVERVESYIMIRILEYPDWFDSHLETLAAQHRPPVRAPRGRARASRIGS